MHKLPKPWREAVRELLRAAKKTRADVAKLLDVDRAIVHRWLATEETIQRRNPNAEDVKRVNAAVAEVIGIPEAVDYLWAVAVMDDGLIGEVDQTDEADVARHLVVMRCVFHYLGDAFVQSPAEVATHLFERDEDSAFRLSSAIAFALGVRLTAHLTGISVKRTTLDEVTLLAAKAGFDLELFIRRDVAFELTRVRERAAIVVDGIIGQSNLPPTARVELSRNVRRAVADAQRETVNVLDRKRLVERVMSNPSEPKRVRRERKK